MGLPQLLASLAALVLPAQPFAVEQVSACQFPANAGTGEAVNRRLKVGLGSVGVADERVAARLQAEFPVCARWPR